MTEIQDMISTTEETEITIETMNPTTTETEAEAITIEDMTTALEMEQDSMIAEEVTKEKKDGDVRRYIQYKNVIKSTSFYSKLI